MAGPRLNVESELTTQNDDDWAAALATLPEATLEEVNRLWTIARAFSNTAHAVNNSLQVIGGRAELLEARTGIDPALMPSLQAMRVQSGRAAAAIGDLLTYSRGASNRELLDLGEMVEVTVAMRAHTLSRARIALTVERQDREPYRAMARRRELMQLLLNLVLMTEARLVDRAQAAIVIRLERAPLQSRVVVTASAAEAPAAPVVRPENFNAGAQQRVMIRLAERLNAELAIESSALDLPAFTLTISSTATAR